MVRNADPTKSRANGCHRSRYSETCARFSPKSTGLLRKCPVDCGLIRIIFVRRVYGAAVCGLGVPRHVAPRSTPVTKRSQAPCGPILFLVDSCLFWPTAERSARRTLSMKGSSLSTKISPRRSIFCFAVFYDVLAGQLSMHRQRAGCLSSGPAIHSCLHRLQRLVCAQINAAHSLNPVRATHLQIRSGVAYVSRRRP